MVFSLVERGGKVRSMHLTSVNADNLRPVLARRSTQPKTRLMTDGEGQYRIIAPMFAGHEAVNHGAGEYVRGDALYQHRWRFLSIFKRASSALPSCQPQHLQRYATEFDFRYNHRESKIKIDGKWMKTGYSDAERTIALLKGISNKRLTYRRINATA